MSRIDAASLARILLIVAFAVAAGIAGCAAGKASIPTAEDLYAAGAIPGGVDPAALRKGRVILVTECATCHRLFLPGEYSPEQWPAIVKRMAVRASLGEDQAADLLLYLSAAARPGK